MASGSWPRSPMSWPCSLAHVNGQLGLNNGVNGQVSVLAGGQRNLHAHFSGKGFTPFPRVAWVRRMLSPLVNTDGGSLRLAEALAGKGVVRLT
jgi:hypothetical protein